MTQGEGGWGKGGGEVYQTVVGMLYLVCERELSVLMSIYIYYMGESMLCYGCTLEMPVVSVAMCLVL